MVLGVQTASIYNIYADHLNTPRLVTNDDVSPVAVWRWDNDEVFGRNAPDENPQGAGPFVFNMRLPGQYFDAETNLHYNYFRDYDPEIGRYVQSDPIGLTGGINTYAYVGSQPVKFIDPMGLCPWCLIPTLPYIGEFIIGGVILMSPPSKKAIKSIAQKIRDLCTPEDKDPCDEQQELEEAACSKYFGHWSYGGCIERARIRGDMCRRKQPNPPPPWSDADVNGWAPPSAPREIR